jgi:pimeloyl-ACP methyl ester carboxylesterase
MRQRLIERYSDKAHCLIQLTLAQDRLFAELDGNLPGYRAIRTPTLILAGAEDRTIPAWVQTKITTILPHTRFLEVPDSGHVVYLEKTRFFFENLKRFAAARSLGFQLPPPA